MDRTGAMAEAPENGARSSREQALEELSSAEKLIVVTHENPDGDAIGSLVATQQILSAMDKDSVMFVAEQDLPLPHEYRFLPLSGFVTSPPEDFEERTAVFLEQVALAAAAVLDGQRALQEVTEVE